MKCLIGFIEPFYARSQAYYNAIHTADADATQIDSWVASASAVWIGCKLSLIIFFQFCSDGGLTLGFELSSVRAFAPTGMMLKWTVSGVILIGKYIRSKNLRIWAYFYVCYHALIASVIRLSYENEDRSTPLQFIAQCSALMLLQKKNFGDYTISSDTLSDIQWFLFLKLAKASKRFRRPSIVVAHWAHVVASALEWLLKRSLTPQVRWGKEAMYADCWTIL